MGQYSNFTSVMKDSAKKTRITPYGNVVLVVQAFVSGITKTID